MGCTNCGTKKDGKPGGCKSNGNCGTFGCNKLNSYDWLSPIVMPAGHKVFDVVEIRFKGSRKEFFRNTDHLELFSGDSVIVKTNNGWDMGQVALRGELVKLHLKKAGIQENDKNIGIILRKATEEDQQIAQQNKGKEKEMLENARVIALELKLAMKISDIELQGDGKKVIFFYTAENRVDFRELIRRYANTFKTRIEMRQISYRQEASRLGGIGVCGRELCCSTWLTDFKVVSISAAKKQRLSINMLKLSGQCGRLKCCLNFELDTYLEALDEFPEEDRLTLETQAGVAKVQKVDLLSRRMWFAYPQSSNWIALDLKEVKKIQAQNKKGILPERLTDSSVVEEVINSGIEIGKEDLVADKDITWLDEKSKSKKEKRNNKGNRKQHFKKKRPQNQNGKNRKPPKKSN